MVKRRSPSIVGQAGRLLLPLAFKPLLSRTSAKLGTAKKATPKGGKSPSKKASKLTVKRKTSALKSAVSKSSSKAVTQKATTRKRSATITKKPQKASSKVVAEKRRVTKKKAAPDKSEKRRKTKVYSSRSTLDSFALGDLVTFKHLRDWNDASRFVEMTGIVVAKGFDPNSGINYIEVSFETTSIAGKPVREIRRFHVK